MKSGTKQSTVMVKVGKSELDEPRAVTFTNEHFSFHDLEMDLLDICFEVHVLDVPELQYYVRPRSVAKSAYQYEPDKRENTLKKLGKPSLALSPPCL
jgi:hypothetical protein